MTKLQLVMVQFLIQPYQLQKKGMGNRERGTEKILFVNNPTFCRELRIATSLLYLWLF